MSYVFLGIGDTDKIKGRSDIVIARDLPDNIEQYPKFCAFTGWYALWKNNLIQTDYFNLLEYDIEIKGDFNGISTDCINKKYEFIGYVPLSMYHAFINLPEYLANIIPSIKKHYNIEINQIVRSACKKDKRIEWSSTSNSTWSVALFNEYMIWFDKLIDDLKDNSMSGHAHERSISFFHLIHDSKVFLIKGLIKHFMLNSTNYQ